MLPFIAGLAFGSLSIVALNNKAKIKEVAVSGLDKSIDKSKNIIKGAKKFTQNKIAKINSEEPKQKKRRGRNKKVVEPITLPSDTPIAKDMSESN